VDPGLQNVVSFDCRQTMDKIDFLSKLRCGSVMRFTFSGSVSYINNRSFTVIFG
jgi:hypothetical protein